MSNLNNPNSSNKEEQVNTNSSQNITPPQSKSDEGDFNKAVAFLLSKETKEYSLEKKKEFLLKKMSPEIVERALSIYPTIESNINSKLSEYKEVLKSQQDNSGSIFNQFFNLGVLSSVLLTTLGVNYLIDMNRNKKNDLFYKDVQKKINEELEKNTKEMKKEISVELNEYVTNQSLKEKVQTQLTEFTQQRGLNFNLSSKSVKDEIVKLKQEVEMKDKAIKELNVKIENNKVILKQEIIKETTNMIDENNNKLLMKIIENQDKLLMMVSKTLAGANGNKSEGILTTDRMLNEIKDVILTNQLINEIPVYKKSQSQGDLMKNVIGTNLETGSEATNSSPVESDTLIIAPLTNDNSDTRTVFENILSSVKEEKNKLPLVKQLNNQLSAILEEVSKNGNDVVVPDINLTNKFLKNANIKLLGNLLVNAGFKAETNNKYKYIGNLEDLKQISEVIKEFDK